MKRIVFRRKSGLVNGHEPAVDLGRSACNDLSISERLEWLVTNGLGGYASGTVAGVLSRRHHGLLIAALHPPLARTLLVTKIDEVAVYAGREQRLSSDRWADGRVHPLGYLEIDRFHLEGSTPVWTFACSDALIEKRVWMEQGANTTYVRYDLRRAAQPLGLALSAFVNHRDHHAATRAGDWRMRVEPVGAGVRVTARDDVAPFFMLSDLAQAVPMHDWHHDFNLAAEAELGLSRNEDHLCAARFRVVLEPGSGVTVVLSTEPAPNLDGPAAYAKRRDYEQRLLDDAGRWAVPSQPAALRQLVLTASQFVVRRSDEDDSETGIIAGYHPRGLQVREAALALPGLTLITGRRTTAAAVLQSLADHLDRGMLPSRLPEAGEEPEYHAADAALWYVEAVRAYDETGDDDRLLRDLYPGLEQIVLRYRQGGRNGVRVDPVTGLLHAEAPGLALTWMDRSVGNGPITPRAGKPVEINALWYHVLRTMADLSRRLGRADDDYTELADRVRISFGRFWSDSLGHCYDVLDGPEGDDSSLRPNQLLAVSLRHSPLTRTQQKAVVDVCAKELLTPHGLRSLRPGHPDFAGTHDEHRRRREGSHHQGTVWSWLIGPFVRAHLRVYRDPVLARSYLQPLLRQVGAHGLGAVGETFLAGAPFAACGVVASARSVAEILRAWASTEP